MRVRRAAARIVLAFLSAVYLAAVAWITLRARPYGAEVSDVLERLLAAQRHAATAWITFERVEFASNVAMFVPLGVFAALWFGVRAAGGPLPCWASP